MNKPNHFEHSPSNKDESKNWKWFREFIATLGVIAIVVIGVSWALVRWAHIPLADLLGGSFFTAFAAVLAAAVIHYRWMQDRAYQEKSEQDRLDIEQRRHREQERGKRQEKMGERVAQAVSHLGEGRSYMQVAGLIELAGVVDDWWSLGREMEVDSKTTEAEEIRKLVKRRRQELIDLIFKYTLHLNDQPESVSAASTEKQRAEMVQNVRSQLLRDHLSSTSDQSNSNEQQPGLYEEYWRHFNLSDAYLSGSDLRNTCLKNTKLSGADLRSANLEGADLRGAHLENV
ncbi:pentapeptide repeat-containing protein, partial [Corynebacterium glutamicum]